MSESKRRTDALSRVASAVRMRSRQGVEVALAVVLQRSHGAQESMRKLLGEMSPTFERGLAAWLEQRESEVFVWVRTPAGKESVRSAKDAAAWSKVGLELLAMEQAIRGTQVVAAVFADEILAAEWELRLESWQEEAARVAAVPVTEMKARRLHAPVGNVEVLTLPIKRDALTEGGTRDVVRVLDSMVRSEEAALKARQSIVVTFEGFDEDKREVWDIPEVKQFIWRITVGAPWWVWLVHPLTYAVWFGSTVDNRGTTVGSDGGAQTAFDGMALSQAVEIALLETAAMMDGLRTANGDEVPKDMVPVAQALFKYLAVVKEKQGGVEAGVARPTIEGGVDGGKEESSPDAGEIEVKKVHERSAASRVEEMRARGDQLILVFDKSESSLMAMSELRKGLLKEMDAACQRWANGPRPMMVVGLVKEREQRWAAEVVSDEELVGPGMLATAADFASASRTVMLKMGSMQDQLRLSEAWRRRGGMYSGV